MCLSITPNIIKKVDICLNRMEVTDNRLSSEQKSELRWKYNIPANKTVFI